MDGTALLNSLADWTAESHPNVSVESRQQTNDLMGELRTELFTLLGSSSQVGGGSDDASGISVVQPMDEELIRQMSPAELSYRLNLAESSGKGMFGGGDDGAIISYDFEQDGGAADNEIGWLQKVKIILGLRKFNQFIDDYEKLRAQINKNMAGYEVEVARGKDVTDKIVKAIRDMFLNKKYEAMSNIMLANEAKLQTGIKKDIVQRRVESAQLEIKRLDIVLHENILEAKKVFLVKSFYSKDYAKESGALWWKKSGFIVNTINEVNGQQKAYLELKKELNYYTQEIERAKNLKALEAVVANKNVSELTKHQRKEIAEYQKNREKYEKMFAFTDTRENEYEELMNKKEKIVDTLNHYNTTLTTGQYLSDQGKMQKALTDWEKEISIVYQNISDAISKSKKYKEDLDNLRVLVANNGNMVDNLIAGMAEFEDVKKMYVKYLENTEKAYEIQEGVGNALSEVKKKFIELIPDASLLPDMHRVVSAQNFVLSITNILLGMQHELGVDEPKGRKFFEDKIKKMKGGAAGNIELTGGIQTGGVNFNDFGGTLIAHGFAFYDHNDRGNEVWSNVISGARLTAGYVPLDTTTIPVQPTTIKILTLPYGVRRISQNYVDNVNNAIAQIADDKVIYIPVINYKNLTLNRAGQYEYDLFTAVYDSTTIRITGRTTEVLSNQRDYCQIHDNYYVYNILEFNGVTNKDRNFRDLLTRTCDALRTMRLAGNDYIILPVFYKLGNTVRTISNPLFEYDEYVLLHPLLGCVMTATVREADLTQIRHKTVGRSQGYEFNDIPRGTPPTLNLNLKLQKSTITIADLTGTNPNNFEYYYNFCGPNMSIRAGPVAGQPHFETVNFSDVGMRRSGNLQPPTQIDMKSTMNEASYAHYMFQLMGHLNEMVNKLAGIKLSFSPVPSANPLFANGQAYGIYGNYSFDYDLANYTAPNKISIRTAQMTQLDHLGIAKVWDDTYADNFFGEHDPTKLVFIFSQIKVMLADLIYWMKNKSIALVDTKSAAGLALYNSAYTAAATAAGIPSSLIPNPGGAGLGPGGVLTPLNPKYTKRMAYLNNALPAGSVYWSNLSKINDIIKKFSESSYQDYTNLLYKAYETMSIIRTYESKILDIKPAKDDFTLPEFSLITANLEPKVEPGSKDAYTNAGQKLYEKLKENKTYIAQNDHVASSDNLVRDLEDLLWEIGRMKNVALEWTNSVFLSMPPGDKYVDILTTQAGATKLINQLTADRKYNNSKTIGKISNALQLILRLAPLDPVYVIYDTLGGASINKADLFNKNKGKGNKGNKKGKSKRTN